MTSVTYSEQGLSNAGLSSSVAVWLLRSSLAVFLGEGAERALLTTFFPRSSSRTISNQNVPGISVGRTKVVECCDGKHVSPSPMHDTCGQFSCEKLPFLHFFGVTTHDHTRSRLADIVISCTEA